MTAAAADPGTGRGGRRPARLAGTGGRGFAHRTVAAVVAGLVLSVLPGSAAAEPNSATAEPGSVAANPTLAVRVVQGGLVHPWDVAVAPGGRMLVTERPGRVRVYASTRPGARLLSTLHVPRVRAVGEAGVMGIGAMRRGSQTLVFVCASRQTRRGWRNQVLRYRLTDEGHLRSRGYLLRWGMRAAPTHNGCAVEVGPDRKVWVTMGDAGDLAAPQRWSRLNGKVLRLEPDGTIPGDNPRRGSPVFSLGHRNPQGIAFAPRGGQPYAVEHGPDVHDEVNRLRAGTNYGWPCWTGAATPGPGGAGCRAASAYARPAWSSGSRTLATSGMTFARGRGWGDWRGQAFVSTLKEADVRRFALRRHGRRLRQQPPPLLDGELGRIRAMVDVPGRPHLLVTTSDGAGDRVVRVAARQGPDR